MESEGGLMYIHKASGCDGQILWIIKGLDYVQFS